MSRRCAYRLTLAGYFGLVALWLIWPTLISPPEVIPVALVLMITLIPLMLPMRGLLHEINSAFIWMAYLSLFYFAHGVTEAAAGSTRSPLAMVETGITVLLYFSITRYLKAPH